MRNSPVLCGLATGALTIVVSLAAAPGPVAAATPGPGTPVPVQAGITAAALPGARPFGNTQPGTPESVSFILRERNLPQLQSAVERGISRFVSVRQFARRYGQSAANVTALEKYLGRYGISTQAYADNVDVSATGTAGEFDRALSVTQRQYRVPRQPSRDSMRAIPAQTVHGIAASPMLPYRIAQYVLAVLGLTSYGPFDSQAMHVNQRVTQPQPDVGGPSRAPRPVACC